METLLSTSVVKTVLVLLYRERFLVVHLYSSCSMLPQDLPLGVNLYKKFCILSYLCTDHGDIWLVATDLWFTPSCKIL